jgi:L,D-transpeptidase ErfK/SrfK
MKSRLFVMLLLAGVVFSCINKIQPTAVGENKEPLRETTTSDSALNSYRYPETIRVNKDIPIRHYFKWMDSMVAGLNATHNYATNEYILVHNNAWILDTLTKTDYYYLKEKGIFNEDSQSLLALRKGQILIIPDSLQTEDIKSRLENTYIDLNIPEFKLRIIQNGQALYKFPVRVGQNSTRFLAMANREVDLRTKPGIGTIIRVNKQPAFINPKDNHRYHSTRRDDGMVTKLPAIPWIEPSINGFSLGQLIHPTTNLETLEKAYSNGCVGLRESDAWIVYYYAPVGTKVVFRYDLKGKDEAGNNIEFNNIYPGFEKLSIQKEALETALNKIDGKPLSVCNCHPE